MNEYDYEHRIMGSDATISIVAEHEAIAETAHARMLQIAEQEEAVFSRFRPNSELSLLNEKRTLTVSPLFMETFLYARDMHERSEGAFNPLVDISRFGYNKDISLVKGSVEDNLVETPYTTDLQQVLADQTSMRISLVEGQRLDFGAFLKGHVAEKMARSAVGCAGVIVNMGGDIYTRGTDVDGSDFTFSIDNPFGLDIAFSLRDGAVATSGTYNRHWTYRGKPFAHILDKEGTLNPQGGLVSVTVIAPTGRDADAFATAALVEGNARMLQAQDFDYYLIYEDGRVISSPFFSRKNTNERSYA